MQADRIQRAQSWRIHIKTKARNFNFKFRFRFNATPTWTLSSSCRLSIVLKLRKFILRINSQPTTTQPKIGGGFIKAKVMEIVHKFRARLAKNQLKIAAKPESHLVYPKVRPMKVQDPIRIGLWVMVGFLPALLAQCVMKNGQRGILMVASAGVFVASLLFKTFKTVKLVKLATLPLVLAATVCYMYFHLDNSFYWDHTAWSWSSDLANFFGM